MQQDNTQRPHKGLHQDNSIGDQPKDTYRFALNAVNETELGDFAFISNEESNEACADFHGYTPIGKVYITENEQVIFLVSPDNSISEIGLLDDNCNYTPVVNDEESIEEDKLNFKVEYQIDATYKSRRGCERTIYFTDDYNKPRAINLDSLEDYVNVDGTWNSKLFNLQKQYSNIPNFQSIEVLDSGGAIEPGSYNIAVQYIDEGLNPTEWITTSPTVKIYNDLSNRAYSEINGSINSDVDYMDFPITGKAIQVNLNNLDPDFLYYRLAIIESNSGSGLVNNVRYTDVIPTSKAFFIYTGTNAPYEGTEEEIQLFTDIVYKAKNIEQIENRLLLANTEGSPVNFCKLQKYASRIKADCITKEVKLNSLIDPSNPKNPSHEMGGVGYMPGEIYSFGIVYIFEDGNLSPVYHIPGKSPDVAAGTIFSPGPNTYPMSQDNTGVSVYTGNDTCGPAGYWGLDSEGTTLEGKYVRHHRFPLRSDINKPLVQIDEETSGEEQEVLYYQIQLAISGQLITPIECPEDDEECTPQDAYPFSIRVNYTADGVESNFIMSVNPATYADGTGVYNLNLYKKSPVHGSSNLVVTSLQVTDINGTYVVLDGSTDMSDYFVSDFAYSTSIQEYSSTVQDKTYKTEILGIKFSGIDLPSIEDTDGEKIVGYYIVRNERTEFEKTIIDSGVLIPTSQSANDKYISTGLLNPEYHASTSGSPEVGKLKKDVWGVIHPEHKFNGKEYVVYDEIIHQGNFKVVDKKYGKITYNDVFDGTSYDGGDKQKEGNDDGDITDGFGIDIISRDNIVEYEAKNNFSIPKEDLKERFYLAALESRSINDNANDVWNIASDNKIGIIQTENEIQESGEFPYVVFRKDSIDPYSNFRVLPYYKESINPHEFSSDTGNVVSIFNGDSYVAPMRYVNTMFWDNRVAKRVGRSNALTIILGAVIAVIGIVLTIFTAGAGSPLIYIGASVAVAGVGATILSSGIKAENANRAYLEEYEKGLRDTVMDLWVYTFYNYAWDPYAPGGDDCSGGSMWRYFPAGAPYNAPYIEDYRPPCDTDSNWGQDGPSDDTIQWIGDCITDLWFESSINISLRNHMVTDVPTYLDAPGRIESGNNEQIVLWEFYGNKDWGANYTASRTRQPVSSLERHLSRKLLVFDGERQDSRYYIGTALGEWYQVNPDYMRKNKQKTFFHLPLEYDCCSDCMEDFPHRVYYSEQSFQEELTDNYRVFLPNNYRDIEAETGEIMNLFKIGNNLFAHTYEGLWQLPNSRQERVNEGIVTYIGTGSFFDVPPQKVVDDDTGSSAGLQHKWSAIKTPIGYFFVTENQRKIYQFDGKQLKPISNIGLSNWFKEHTEILLDRQYRNTSGYSYPYRDNPSNLFGSGFISTYDTKKERMIFTKKDIVLSSDITDNEDYGICIHDGQVIIFPNMSDIIQAQQDDGWSYEGLEDCRMKFSREVEKTRTEIREVEVTVPNTAHIYAYFDISGSFDNTQLQSIRDAVDAWYSSFRPDDVGMTRLHKIDSSTERWLDFAAQAASDPAHSGDILVLTFVNESNTTYHTNGDIINPMTGQPTTGTTSFTTDYNFFVNSVLPGLNFFLGITYPIATNYSGSGSGPYGLSRAFVQHTLLAVNGTSYSTGDANAIINTLDNTIFDSTDKSDLLATMTAANPYQSLGTPLKELGWLMKVDRNDLDYLSSGGTIPVITPEQFTEDINALLADSVTYEEVEVEVTYLETEYMYIDGEVIDDPVELDNSWTMSYSLKLDTWTSWHSYIPNFYLNVPEKFYSWIYGSNFLWKHNTKGKYQSYYGVIKPHILEYVSLSNPLSTRIWNHIRLLTEAKKFIPEMNSYYDERFITFDQMVLYNSRQCSGLVDLIVKDTALDQQNYLLSQVVNSNNNSIIIDRNERDWLVNDLRDIRVDYNTPIWNNSLNSVQNEYFIDKTLNTLSLDVNKDWTQLESFRDKYLVIRLIFNNFAEPNNDVKLITNYSIENEQQSFY